MGSLNLILLLGKLLNEETTACYIQMKFFGSAIDESVLNVTWDLFQNSWKSIDFIVLLSDIKYGPLIILNFPTLSYTIFRDYLVKILNTVDSLYLELVRDQGICSR